MLKKITILFSLSLVFLLASGCIRVENVSTGGGIYKSVDGGNNWQQKISLLSLPQEQKYLDNIETNVFVFDPQDFQTIYLGTKKNGLFVSFDGAESWQEVKRLPKGKISSLAVDPKAKHIVYAGIENRIFKTKDANRTWESVYLDTFSDVEISALAINHLFPNIVTAGFSDGRLIRSEDGGLSWTPLNNFKKRIGQVLINPYNPQIIYVTLLNQEIFRSENHGIDWKSLKERYHSFSGAEKIHQLVFNPNFPDALISISEAGLLHTEDGGQNWTEYKLITSGDKVEIYSFAVHPQNTDIIYYATNKTLYKSIDNGENWITKPIPSKNFPNKILIDPVNPDTLYLGMINLIK
ncbi:hypothetical protein KKG58_01560 [Patescibacteria group bacterium]|nr:hypothetical protein [Patescibacteria group bacterium]